MGLRLSFLVLLIAGSGTISPAVCAEPELRVRWQNLERLTKGRRIVLELPSGIKLQGEAIAFEREELVFDIRKTSNRHAYPKGRAIVPRAEVRRLIISKPTRRWRIVGTSAGAALGTMAAVPYAIFGGEEGTSDTTGGAVLMFAASAAAGYLIGWAADRGAIHVVVEADR